MDDTQLNDTTASLIGDSPASSLADVYVELAKAAVVAHLFPYRDDASWADVPAKHHMRTCEIAAYLANKRGAEGETQHNESGIGRTYGAAAIPSGYFDGMAPFAGVPR